MNTCIPMQADAEAIGAFVNALFRYADQDTYVSLRAFREPPENAARHPAAWRINPALHANFATRAAHERDRRERAKAEMQEAMRRHRQENPQ